MNENSMADKLQENMPKNYHYDLSLKKPSKENQGPNTQSYRQYGALTAAYT
jgi:hypothetical protein